MPLRDMGREQIWMLPPTLDELAPLEIPDVQPSAGGLIAT